MIEEDSAAISKRRRLAWWLWLPVFIGLLVVAWKAGQKEPLEPWPVLCLHADGKVTLGSFEGRSLSKQEVVVMGKQMPTDTSPRCLILKPAAGLPMEAWWDTLNATCEAGIGSYEVQSGSRKLAFQVPGGCCMPRRNSPPEIIDLRRDDAEEEDPHDDDSDYADPEDAWNPQSGTGFDVHVIARPSMSFEDLHDAIAPQLRPGVSMMIAGPRYCLLRDKDEDRQHLPPKKPSRWERMKEKVEEWVK